MQHQGYIPMKEKYYTDESRKITNKIQVSIRCKNGQQLTPQAIDIRFVSSFNPKLLISTLTKLCNKI